MTARSLDVQTFTTLSSIFLIVKRLDVQKSQIKVLAYDQI